MYHPFSVGETLKTSWGIFRKNFVTIIVFSVLSIFIVFVASLLYQFTDQQSFISELIIAFIVLLIQSYSTLGLYKLIFTLIDSEYYEFSFSQIVPKIRMVLSYIAVGLAIAILVVINKVFVTDNLTGSNELVANIVETVELFIGLFLALRLMFFICFIVDDDSGPVESLRQSFLATRDNMLKIILLLVIILLLIALPIVIANVLNLSIFGIVLILTYPFVNIVLVVAYRKLVYSHIDADDDVSETL